MNITVFGASGGCGRWIVEIARGRKHQVTAFVRPATPFTPPEGVRVVRGSVLDAGVVEGAVAGADAVLSGLGLRRRHPRNPWSRLVSPPDLVSRATRTIVGACVRHGTPRIAIISAGGVGGSAPFIPAALRFLIASSNVGVAYRDLARAETILGDSPLDWMAVRPVTLVDGPQTKQVSIVARYRMSSTISRADVAAWMVSAVDAGAPFAERTPMIGRR